MTDTYLPLKPPIGDLTFHQKSIVVTPICFETLYDTYCMFHWNCCRFLQLDIYEGDTYLFWNLVWGNLSSFHLNSEKMTADFH